MKLWGPVPWWRETRRGGRRWSLRWCTRWGRCWSSWAHCLWSWWQSMFSPGLQDSLLLALVFAAPLLTRLWAQTLKLSAVAPTLRVWAGRGDSLARHLKLCHNQIFSQQPSWCFLYVQNNVIHFSLNYEILWNVGLRMDILIINS